MSAMIEAIHLRKQFGAFLAVEDVSFSVNKGEVLGFLGPNGAGKSTTMKMITGFITPTDGQARVNGLDVRDNPIEVKRAIGYLPEGAPAYGDMTTLRFLQFIAEIRGIETTQRSARIDEVVERVNLGGVLYQSIDTLSKGFKRRVGLAQALIHDPQILILDEPTDGLDPNQKHEVRELIRQMASDKAIVISTHILEEVQAVCNKAVIIAQGKVRFDGTPEELAARSRYHNAVSLVVDNSQRAAVRSALEGLAQVGQVSDEEQEGRVRLTAFGRDGSPILDPVGDLIRKNNWQVHELRTEAGRLDEVFREITVNNA